jgi:hypothetical protein
MANLQGKTIVKLLLLITLVIQPVSIAYVMASMGQSHHAQSPLSVHNGGHADNSNMTDTHDQYSPVASGEPENCCLSAVCSPASVMSDCSVAHVKSSQYIATTVASLISIDLPAEIKPPRNLLG